MKTTAASMRGGLIELGFYLPNHRKNYTSSHYMKKVLSGDISVYELSEIKFVTVPLYDEF